MKPHQIEWRDAILGRKSINLDISNLCTLECPRCDRQKKGRPVPGHNMTVEEFTKIADYFDKILFCGQISDPIFNPNLLDFIQIAKEKGKQLNIHTAASQRPTNWWSNAFDTIDKDKSKWIFALDGLPKDSHKYRINQDGEHVWEMMKLAVSKGVNVGWQYIVFKYNEDDIETCKQMAIDNGIQFNLMHSSRWRGRDDPYKPSKNYRMDR